MSAADDFTDAFDALIKEMGPANALVVITGAFVSLTLAVVKNAGHSIGGDLKIDGGKQRDITIHAPKPAQQASDAEINALRSRLAALEGSQHQAASGRQE